MKTQREKIILNYFAPHKAMDVIDLYTWLAPDITIVEPEQLPWGGSYHGIQGVGAYMTNVTSNIISEIRLDDVYSCGDTVIAIGWSNGRTIKTGKQFQIRVTQLYTFNQDGKICRVEFFSDMATFLELLEMSQASP
ncbi:MAG: nuclear transport factor 2 family protein [Saprospiraceae bacterium]|nr:nuclear transport factor 2 family protein [Saprospiraceae bacterium]MCF8249603.1 nuclear transport factor 2 family protein [Saprospiraceae bacterium]MCF8280503.1 nuclear transport factor 2 family protein [Bacteroidales bacterium]MCF8310435.1 nuclear transport factor 2 family protein [Saprospiraceae bacterium]MCF8439813.1 nuclear transport factor 2 family protein [Saprospiraceae bacterium]